MSYISFQPNDYFNTKLYTGNGSTNAITGVGFQPDWVWIKHRGDTHDHNAYDAVRGVTKMITPNENYAESTVAASLTSFDSDGFTLGNVARSNASGGSLVSWNWKANGAGSSNTDGSITSTVSASTTSGFSIVKYTGNGVDNSSIGHGLNAVPEMIILKGYSGAEDWMVYHKGLTAGYEIRLNSSGAESDDSSNATWGDNHPNNINSSTFEVGYAGDSNGSGTDYIAYCFHSVKGFSKFGSYTGNGNADGSFIYTGMSPAFVILKNTATTDSWVMYDNKRPNPYNVIGSILQPNTSIAETANSAFNIDFVSSGFKIRGTDSAVGGNGNKIIYMAFASAPLVSSNGVPAVAR